MREQKSIEPVSPWYTPRASQRYSRRSNNDIYGALSSGALRGVQVNQRGDWRIHVDDLDAWIRSGCPVTADDRELVATE